MSFHVRIFLVLTAALLPGSLALRGAEPGEKEKTTSARTDLHGDPLPPGAVARLGTIRFRHAEPILSVGFSPDGSTLVTGAADHDGTVRLWDVVTGKELRRFRNTTGRAIISPDGRSLAMGIREGEIVHLELSTGRELARFPGSSDLLAFAPDGKTLLAKSSTNESILLHDAATGKELRRLEGQHGRVFSLAFSPDGKTLSTGGEDKTVRFWEVATGKEVRLLNGHQHGVSSLVYSPDGNKLATACYYAEILLWDVTTGNVLLQLSGRGMLVFSPDGKILAARNTDDQIQLWEIATGKELRRLPGVRGDSFMAFAPDGKIMAASSGPVIRLWEIATGKEIHPSEGHQHTITSVSVSANGKLLASRSWDAKILLWDVSSGTVLRKFDAHWPGTEDVTLAPDGKILASSSGASIALWETATGEELWHLVGEGSALFSSEGKILVLPANARLVS